MFFIVSLFSSFCSTFHSSCTWLSCTMPFNSVSIELPPSCSGVWTFTVTSSPSAMLRVSATKVTTFPILLSRMICSSFTHYRL